MDHDTIALMQLKEQMRLRQQRQASGPRPAKRSDDSADQDDVSNWYTDELGNQSRIIKARD
jgi:hypothetical protein